MPTLYVIAGPNGIGKTTSSYDVIPLNTPIINSDEIAKEIKNTGIIPAGNTQEYSNSEAIRLMEEQRKLNNSFAIETNLADVDTWKFLLEMQKTGYELHVLYMSTDNVDVLNKRIQERVQLGDHFVNPSIVEERYVTGLKLLNHYFSKPDRLQLFDNSTTVQLLADIRQGENNYLIQKLPNWVIKYLGQHFQQKLKQKIEIKHMKNVDEVKKAYKKLRHKP
jgi:predicted ABC-type ATPase